MKNETLFCKFRATLVDYYIAKEMLPALIFYMSICTIVSEVIGISFEQAKLTIEEEVPISIAVYIHLLKLPHFIYLSLPFSILIATVSIYTKLSNKNEIIALQSFGISVYRLILPTLAITCITAILAFTSHELIVPKSNYRAAIILEHEWNIDRKELSKYNKQNIIYQEFENNQNKQQIKLLFFAEKYSNKIIKEITLIKYQESNIKQIITARSAKWEKQQQEWKLFSGSLYVLNKKGTYIRSNDFNQLSLKLSKNLLNYVDHHRDNREMNIIDLYRRLVIMKFAGNKKQFRALKISIHERYAEAFSCITFAFLGSVLGINYKIKDNRNSLSVALIVIFIYYSIRFLSTAMAASETISIFWGVWFPNLLSLVVGCFILKRTQHNIT